MRAELSLAEFKRENVFSGILNSLGVSAVVSSSILSFELISLMIILKKML